MCHGLNKLCAAPSWLSRPGFQEHTQQSTLLTQAIRSLLIPQHDLTEPAGMAGCRASWQRQGLPRLRAGGLLPSSALRRSCGELAWAQLSLPDRSHKPRNFGSCSRNRSKTAKPPIPNSRMAFACSRKPRIWDQPPQSSREHTEQQRALRRMAHSAAGMTTGPAQPPSGTVPLVQSKEAAQETAAQTHWRGELGNLEFKCFGSPIRLTFTVIWS